MGILHVPERGYMKQMGKMLLNTSAFSEIVMGNTALVRAMVESGTRVVTSYPGSPTPEIADAIRSIEEDSRPFYFEFSVNEKVATEVAFGASVNGHLSTVFFKSVGLNVAADSFVQLSLLNLTGGMIVVLGDDPGANSSQNEQDNRHFARLSYMPVFEPASVPEVYTMYKAAAALSQKMQMPVILRLTTHVCHAKEKVEFSGYEQKEYDYSPAFNRNNGPYVPITKDVFPLKRNALKKLKNVAEYSEKCEFNKCTKNDSKRGIITFGLPYLSVMDSLNSAFARPDILKLGMHYPIPAKKISEFLCSHEEVKIIEELDDILETDIKRVAYEQNIDTKIMGKSSQEDWIGEYTAEKVYEILRFTWPDIFPEKEQQTRKMPSVPLRPAQMCPGCGHRSAFYAVKKALDPHDITVADIGCHSLGYYAPYNMGEVLLCMGHSTATASGLSLFNKTRKVVAFLGDSTFFHAGIPGIVNALFNKHSVTLIIMENGTTAMTGHQNHPGAGRNFRGIVDAIPVKQVLSGFGIKNIRETDTYNQKKLAEQVKEALNEEGFSVVIARHPCMLKYTRQLRKKDDYQQRHVEITEKCSQAETCIAEFACPSFQRFGDKITVNEELCIGDGSCIQTCFSQAIRPKKEEK